MARGQSHRASNPFGKCCEQGNTLIMSTLQLVSGEAKNTSRGLPPQFNLFCDSIPQGKVSPTGHCFPVGLPPCPSRLKQGGVPGTWLLGGGATAKSCTWFVVAVGEPCHRSLQEGPGGGGKVLTVKQKRSLVDSGLLLPPTQGLANLGTHCVTVD